MNCPLVLPSFLQSIFPSKSFGYEHNKIHWSQQDDFFAEKKACTFKPLLNRACLDESCSSFSASYLLFSPYLLAVSWDFAPIFPEWPRGSCGSSAYSQMDENSFQGIWLPRKPAKFTTFPQCRVTNTTLQTNKQTNNDNKIRSQTLDYTKPWAFILFSSKQMLGSFHSPPFFLTFQAHSACLKHEGQKRERQIIATSTLRPLGTQRILHSSQQNVSAGNYTIMLQSYKHLFAVLTLLPWFLQQLQRGDFFPNKNTQI